MKKNVTLLIFFVFLLFAKSSWAQCWQKVSGGYYHTIAIRTDGSLWAWGANNYGQLGNGTNTDSNIPVHIGSATNWKDVAAGGYFSFGLKTDGTIWAWGINAHGELGINSTTDSNVPVQIGTDTDWKSIAAGHWHGMALKNDSTLWSWGHGAYGALGLGSTSDQWLPQAVDSTFKWKSISTGGVWALGIRNDGTMWACGNDDHGMIGVSTGGIFPSFTQIGTDNDWKVVSAGTWHGLAIKNAGTLYSWGYNSNGQLGDNNSSTTWIYSYIPTLVGTDSDWKSISGGELSTLALKNSSHLYAWGNNNNYQLGDNTTMDRLIPTLISSATNWQIINASTSHHSLAIKSDKTLWSWGRNLNGEGGQGTFVDIQIPTQVICTNPCNIQAPYPYLASNAACYGQATGYLQALTSNFTGGIAPYSVVFNSYVSGVGYVGILPTTTTSSGGAPAYLVFSQPAGSYQVTITDVNGCSLVDTLYIDSIMGMKNITVVNAACNINNGSISFTSTSAPASPLTVSYSGPMSGTLSTVNTGTTTLSGLAPGTYTITTYLAAWGCTQTEVVTVGSAAPVTFTATAGVATCGLSNGSITINTTVGNTVTLNTGTAIPITTNPQTISGLAAGMYTVVITNAAGCTATDLLQIFCTAPVVGAPCTSTFEIALNNIGNIASNGGLVGSEIRLFPYPDGSYFVTGLRNDSTTITHFDAADVLLWTKAFKFVPGQAHQIHDMIVNNDGSLIGISNFSTFGCAFRLDASFGTILWLQASPLANNYYENIHSINNTECVITATRNYNSHLFTIDKSTGTPNGTYSKTAAGGDYYSTLKNGILYGTCRRYIAGSDLRAAIFAHDANTGNFIGQKTALTGTGGNTRMYPVAPIADDTMLVMGSSGKMTGFNIYTTGGTDLVLSKTKSTGIPVWTKKYASGFTRPVITATINSATGYYMVGNYYMPAITDFGYGFIIKVDKNGVVQWAKALGAAGKHTQINNLIEHNGAVYVALSSTSFSTNRDLILIKMTLAGITTCPLVGNLQITTTTINNSAANLANGVFDDSYSLSAGNAFPLVINVLDSMYCINCCPKQVSINSTNTNNAFCKGNAVCLSTTINGVLNPAGAYTYQWYNSTTSTIVPSSMGGTSASPCITGLNVGTYQFQNIVSTNNGHCHDTGTITITIYQAASSFNDSTCAGTPYYFNNQNLEYSGAYNDTLISASGCDSIITLNLTVIPSPISFVTGYLCGVVPYVFGGNNIYLPGTYYDTIPMQNGCDSIVELILIDHNSTGTVNAVVSCNTYNINGVTYPAPGSYTQILTNQYGCDSLLYINVTTVATSSCITSLDISTPSNWTLTGALPLPSTMPTFSNSNWPGVYTAIPGATWIRTLSGANNATHYYFEREFYVCTPDMYTLNICGAADNRMDVYIDNIAAANQLLNISCGSCTSSFNTPHCTTGSRYLSAGLHKVLVDLYNSGSYTGFVISGSITGTCLSDSACIQPCICTSDTVYHTACDSFVMPWQTYTANGMHVENLVNAGGCDSIVTHMVTINHSTSSTTTLVACDSLTWNGLTFTQSTSCGGGIQAFDGSANYYQYLTFYDYDNCYFGPNTVNEGGVGYVVDGHVKVQYDCSGIGHVIEATGNYATVNPVGSIYTYTGGASLSPTMLITPSCMGSTVYYELTIPATIGYTVHLTNAAGCDSSATLMLTINLTTTTSTYVTACDSFTWSLNNQLYASSGVYTQVGTNANGCPHIDSLVLTINHSTSVIVSQSTCENMPYNFYGTMLNTTGTYVNHLTNASGCDSTITLQLTVLPVDSTHVYDTICDGDSYLFDGSVLTTSGVYKQLIISSLGCDSIILLHLTVVNVYAHVTNSATTLTADIVPGATYQWVKCPEYTDVVGETSEIFTPTMSGNYAVIVSLAGCNDTSNCTCTIMDGVGPNLIDESFKVYPNPTSDFTTIQFKDVVSNLSIKVYSYDGKLILKDEKLTGRRFEVSLKNQPTGVYVLELILNDNRSRLKLIKK
jgi:alpha-tubulin suppressor-like RCC1 family protein